MEVDARAVEGIQIALEVEHCGRVALGEEPGAGREEVDLPQGCATAEHAEVGEQEPSDIQPLESALPGRGGDSLAEKRRLKPSTRQVTRLLNGGPQKEKPHGP